MKSKVLEIGKWVLIVLLGVLIIYLFRTNRQLESSYESYKKDGTYVTTYQSKTINELKRENKELYDSIKKKKDVKQAAIIKYKYEYKGETIYLDRKIPPMPDSIYTFKKNSDSISYTAKVKSSAKPEWCKVDFTLNDKLTLINREQDGKNELSITTNGGTIDGTVVFNKDDKKDSFFNRFSVGINAGVGYGLITKNPDVFVGIGISFRLNKQK